jgi:RNA polymerase sporulation-specific sigma factor
MDELLLKSKSGDPDAIEKMLIKYRPLISRIARNYYCSGIGDTEDLIQEGTIGFLQSIRSYDTAKGENFFLFASVCIRNKIVEALRVAGRSVPILPITEEVLETDLPPLPDPYDGFFEREETTALLKTLKTILSKRQFLAISLYLKGYSYKEISVKMNMPLKSIDNLIAVAKNKIKSNGSV